MDAANDPTVGTIVLMFAAQTGKTSIEENIVAFHMDQDPSPILFVMPTLEMAEAFSKDRLAPMLRDTPALAKCVGGPSARDTNNTLRHKSFAGGHITLAGANSPASLASRPIRLLIADEIDRFPPSAGTEGDPVALAIKRTTTFWNRLIVLSATPTIKGFSRIEDAYEESDKQQVWVPCLHCGHEQVLVWRQVKWPKGRPEGAEYCCEECGALWSDVERHRNVYKGEWRASAPFNGTAGFHLNELYSPWVSLADTAKNFLEAKPHPERLKVWINTALAETWEEDAESIDAHSIEARAEEWGDLAPRLVLLITAGVDVQDDRLEVELVGWGLGEESWSLAHKIIYGDPSAPELWEDLDEYLLTPIITEAGYELSVAAVCVDTGGHHTQAAYDFCRPRFGRRVYAIKGMSRPGERRPVWPKRASKNNVGGVNLFMIGVDAGKDMVIARLKQSEAGPGYCHFPKNRDAEYFQQLTAEKVVTQYVKGFPKRVYIKQNNIRNEALDLRVYAYAALLALNVRWGALQANLQSDDLPAVDPADSPLAGPPAQSGTSSPETARAGAGRFERSSIFNG